MAYTFNMGFKIDRNILKQINFYKFKNFQCIAKQLHFVKNNFFKFEIFTWLCPYEVHRGQSPSSFATERSACVLPHTKYACDEKQKAIF